MGSFWNELKRRNVVRVAVAYALVAWVALQVIDFALEVISAPHWILQVSALLAGIGFPAVLVFAWVYEVTPEGLKLEKEVKREVSIAQQTGRKLDRAIIGILVLVVVTLGLRLFVFPDDNAIRSDADRSGVESIAVLPFEDYSENRDQEYFSKGIAEEILNLLAKTNSLRVAARTSSFAFAGDDTDIREIGRKLQVSTVLEGSIRKAGPTVRITAQLIDVDSGYHLWSETYDRDFVDIFKIQDEIAASIINSLKVHLLGDDSTPVVSERAANVDAYSAYLIGRERMSLRTQQDIIAAREQFEEALQIDPDYAPAHVQLAHAWLLLEQDRFGGADMDRSLVDAAVNPHLSRALELAPDLPEAVAVLGFQHLRRFRYAEAAAAFDRALTLNPNYALAYNWRADTAYEQGRFLDMLADKERAYALDPMSLEISADLAYEYRSFGRPDDADRVIKRMFDLHPGHVLAYQAALDNLDAMGHESEAALLAEQAIAAHPDDANFKDWLAYMLLEMGLLDETIAIGLDEPNFTAFMLQGRNADAKLVIDRQLRESNPSERWLLNASFYSEIVDGAAGRPQRAALMARLIAKLDAEKRPWKNRCAPWFADSLQQAGFNDEADIILDVCRQRYGQRLEAGYLCPCEWFGLVVFTLLDNDIDLAVQRTEKWLDDGDSASFVKILPVFKRLADRPEYASLLARNDAEVARERAHYLAVRQARN
ncbi:MAG: hypothetical protein OEW64_00710 [Gammaproteobacteria bacterium]|nr:hypothetical protein [Gammaproteobacteria bacterium]MDH5302600.1 hypothetical protein [Gammaproteobacteria bacterium]MDH5323080.1 hypothetical protein [Gammaproteobacteria bacterium]